MSPEDVRLVQASFSKIIPVSSAMASAFYRRLFEIAPQYRLMFPADMKSQRAKLVTMLSAVVEGLHDIDEILPVAAELAQRHVEYGVKPEDYQPVGAALIHAVSEVLEGEMTPEVREAWLNAYADLSAAMITAAYGQAAE